MKTRTDSNRALSRTYWVFFVTTLFLVSFSTKSFPNQDTAAQSKSAEGGSETATDEDSVLADPDAKQLRKHSDAEKVGELQQSLDQDREQLKGLENEFENPNSEYAESEREFKTLNSELELTMEELEKAKGSNEPANTQRLEQEISSLHRRRKLAEDRFDLAIEDRKTLRDQRATLRDKIENDKKALDTLTGESELDSEANGEGSPSEPNKSDSQNDKSYASTQESQKNQSDEIRDGQPNDEVDHELVAAAAEATEKENDAEAAQQESQSIAMRLADIQKLVSQEQKELNLARKKVDLATASQLTLSQELARRQAENADASDLNELRVSISQASQRLIHARTEVTEISERLNDHRAEQSSLQAEHIVALHEAEQKRHEATAAEDRVESLRNPFTPRNILQWILEHGPRLLLIIGGMFLLNRLASFFAARSVQLVSSGSGRGSTAERENRAKTLVGVFQNAATVAIFVSGGLMTLEEVGANITVLMGGVAVIGLAVAFGAQNLIKDYFYGFVMLLENQYMLNDSVRIGGVSGQVERITLRMTVLRDSNGIVHFIPNGTINSVSNETHGWSRAVCEIAISHHENLERVFDALRAVSREISSDPVFGKLILETPSDPAIDSLGESAVNLKVSAKTFPNKHGGVKQEWLRRIKNRFHELGIEPPIQLQRVHVYDKDSTMNTAECDSFSIRRAS